MPAEDHFINRGILKVKINDYLRRELRRAGYAGLDLQKTPLGMRVVVYAARPGMVIGRRGTTVRELTETLEHEFGLEAPQIEVSEIEVPELNGDVMAERLAQRLERGDHFRRAAYGVLRRIIGAGAIGVEISIKGKLTSRRARYQKFRSGFVAKTGEPVRTNVSHGIAYAILKPGILGVQVRIMLPDAVSPDRPTIIHREVEPEVEIVPAEGEEIEIVEEEIPIEEVTEVEEILVEGEQIPREETEEVPPIIEPEVMEEPKPSEELQKEPEPLKPEAKPEPKVKEEKPKEAVEPKPKKKPLKKKEVKPKAKPKPEKKEKVEEKPKAKPKPNKKVDKVKEEAKPKAKPKAKLQMEKKPKEKKPKAEKKVAEKPKTQAKKTKAKAEEKAPPKPRAKTTKKAEKKPKKGAEKKPKRSTKSKSSKEKK